MLKELFLGLLVVLSIVLFFGAIGIEKYLAVLGTVYGIIRLIPLVQKKKVKVTK